MKEYAKVAQALLDSGAYQAVLYVSPTRTIKATRKRLRGKFDRRSVELILTDGPPAYAERQRIKLLKKAGEPFPVKKVQLRIAS
jgi:hypothetical protein